MGTTAILSQGVVPTAETVAPTLIYTPLINTVVDLSSISVNTIVSDKTTAFRIIFWKLISGATDPVVVFDYSLAGGSSVRVSGEDCFCLNSGDSLHAYCSVEDLCVYDINGKINPRT